MPVQYPETYRPYQLQIDKNPFGAKQDYTIRVVPPVPVNYELDEPVPHKLDEAIPVHVVNLAAEISDIVGHANHDTLPEVQKVIGDIEQSGCWIHDFLLLASGNQTQRRRLDGKHPIREEFRQSIREAVDINDYRSDWGLRILLHFGSKADELSKLMWETWYMNRGSGSPYLIRRRGISIERYVPSLGFRLQDAPLAGPLRILICASRYNTEGKEDANLNSYINAEVDALTTAVARLKNDGLIDYGKPLIDPTKEQLSEKLSDADIFHYFGHGAIDEARNEAFIILRNHNGRGIRIYRDELKHIFDPVVNSRLKLAVLNACVLQRAGLGSQIARFGVPAVIAMQSEISTKAVNEVFTPMLYASIAAGDPVHVAVKKSRDGIWKLNPIEPFIPVLISSTRDPVTFKLDPALGRKAQAAAHNIQPPDPNAEKARQAAQHLRHGQYDDALALLKSIESSISAEERQAAYGDLSDQISDIEKQRDRHQQSAAIADQLTSAFQELEIGHIEDLIKDSAPFRDEPAVLEATTAGAKIILESVQRLERDGDWLRARQWARSLANVCSVLPEERRPTFDTRNIEQNAARVQRETETTLRQYQRDRQWSDIVRVASEYLGMDPSNSTIQSLRVEALAIDGIQEEIRFDDIIDVTTLLKRLEDARKEPDWPSVKQNARDVLRLQPDNRRAKEMLGQALIHEADQYRSKGRWAEAGATYAEVIELDPRRPDAVSKLGESLIGLAAEAERHQEWDKVRDIALAIINNPALRPKHSDANRMLKRADDAIAVLRRVTLL